MMFYYSHNIGDWATETQGLDLAHLGAYVRLIDRYASTEKPIKTDWVFLAFTSETVSIAKNILSAFFEPADGSDPEASGWVHPRISAEIEAFRARAEKNKANGKRGGRPKKANETQSVSVGFPNESETKAKKSLTVNRKPITVNQYKETTLTGGKENPAAIADATAPAIDAVSEAETKKPEKRKSPATRCPFSSSDSIPQDFETVAEELGVENPQRVFSRFVAHAEANDRRAVRWKAAFRMWCMKEIEFNPPKKTLEQEQEEQKKRVLAQIEAEGF